MGGSQRGSPRTLTLDDNEIHLSAAAQLQLKALARARLGHVHIGVLVEFDVIGRIHVLLRARGEGMRGEGEGFVSVTATARPQGLSQKIDR